MINLDPEFYAKRIHTSEGLLWDTNQEWAMNRGRQIIAEQIENIARLCHAANRGICEGLRDRSQVAWEATPTMIQDSVLAGVRAHLDNPNLTPEQSHESWLAYKQAEGWVWGPAKNYDTKEHPCMVAYDQLPQTQKIKDYVFKCIVQEAASQIHG